MNDYICASVKTLETIKLDCDAELIRAIWKAKNSDELKGLYPPSQTLAKNMSVNFRLLPQLKRACVDHAAGFHGVEYLGVCKRTYYNVHYCNAGDPYAGTIVFIGKRLIVTTWGDMVERGQVVTE